MSLTTEEKQRLWHLFQACDTDSDGLVNQNDVRLLSSRSEFSDYNIEEIIDIFNTVNNDNDENCIMTFEDFIEKKLAHERLSQMSETTSISSGFTNTSTDESITDAAAIEYGKRYFNHRHHRQRQYDDNLNKYKNNLRFCDEIDSTLSKSMDNLQLDDGGVVDFHGNSDAITRRVFTAIPMGRKNHHHHHQHRNIITDHRAAAAALAANKFIVDINRFKSNKYLLPEEIERFDMSDDAKKKFELIRQDYFNCLNELSEENENICEELDRTRKERNYLREKIDILREEYGENLRKHREQWLCERQKLEQKITNLETYVTKIQHQQTSISSWPLMMMTNNPLLSDVINDNNPNESAQDYLYSENFKLHQLANKISELALFLSEILSNLRKSEIDIMVANYRAAGIVKNVTNPLHRNDIDEENDIMQCYERAMVNRSMIEREAIDFVRNIDKEILVQYLSPLEFQKLFNKNNNNRQSTTSTTTMDFQEFQNILSDLLIKLKDDLRNVNKTLDHHHHHHHHIQHNAQNDEQNDKLSIDTYSTYLQQHDYNNYKL
ncbi:hypothetical protein DERF_013063 [Dermatophagoides farinae]|uniref:EF-hand domain-containing protein n=2 Tax=Dermatophagoides farinae TaxID=6954 RepID=A0A922HNR5_DERFA|nr:hypothetical protein DERF_013063 [Dermatophagoides farinae]